MISILVRRNTCGNIPHSYGRNRPIKSSQKIPDNCLQSIPIGKTKTAYTSDAFKIYLNWLSNYVEVAVRTNRQLNQGKCASWIFYVFYTFIWFFFQLPFDVYVRIFVYQFYFDTYNYISSKWKSCAVWNGVDQKAAVISIFLSYFRFRQLHALFPSHVARSHILLHVVVVAVRC